MTPFPIDYVITYVDGADPIHQEERKKALDKSRLRTGQVTAATTTNRWTNHNELFFAVASVRKFAPFVRHIFVVVSLSQRPMVPKDSNVTFVDDLLLFPAGYQNRPSFNSHAIEACLCFIPDLAEHFLYGCDDMFLAGAEFAWDDFFDTVTHQPRFFQGEAFPVLPEPRPLSLLPTWYAARLQNRKLLAQVFPRITSAFFARDAKHQVRPVLKSVMLWMWQHAKIRPFLQQTVATPFRHFTNLEPVGFAVQAARALMKIQPKPPRITCIYITMRDQTDMVHELLQKRNISTEKTLLCVNDETQSGRCNTSLTDACHKLFCLPKNFS